MNSDDVIVSYLPGELGVFVIERPITLMLNVVVDTDPTLLHPGVIVQNGSYSFLYVQLFDYLPFDVESLVLPTTVKQDSKYQFYDYLFAQIYGRIQKQKVEPRAGFLPSSFGTGKVNLNHDFVGRYKMEIVGPSLRDPAGVEVPPAYHHYSLLEGNYYSIWERLWGITIFNQFILPFKSPPMTNGMKLIKLFVGLVQAIVKFKLSTLNPQEPSLEPRIDFLTSLFFTLKDAVLEPDFLPDNTFIKEEATRLHTYLVDVNMLNKFIRFFGFWVPFLELSIAIVNLSYANPVNHFLIDIPARYKVGISFSSSSIANLKVLARNKLDLDLNWQEISLRYENYLERKSFRTEDSHFYVMGTMKTEQIEFEGQYRSAQVITLTDIYEEVDGNLLPILLDITFTCISTIGGRLPFHLEPWDPQSGSESAFLEFNSGLGDWFVCDRVGSGKIIIDVVNHSPFFKYGYNERFSQEIIDIAIEKSAVEIILPEILEPDLHVGDRVAIDFQVQMPSGLTFDSNKPFRANIVESDDFPNAILIKDIWVPIINRWTGEEEVEKLPVNIQVVEASLEDDTKCLNFVLPDPIEISGGLPQFNGLGAFIEGRREGSKNLIIYVQETEDTPHGVEANKTAQCEVNIEGINLELALTSFPNDSDDEGKLLLEKTLITGNQDPEKRNLVGSVEIEVRAEDKRLYYSDEVALLEGLCDDDELEIDNIWTQDEDTGEWHLQPFGIRMWLEDASDVARFTLEHVTQADVDGEFSFYGPLTDFIKAIGPGDGILHGEINQPENQEDLDYVYTISEDISETSLNISVPKPLMPRLETWVSGVATFNFGSEENIEVIHNEGTLTGSIANHRPGSTAERIKLVTSFGATYEYPNIELDIQDDGSFQIHTDYLRLLKEGSNQFTLLAWKPIHEIIGESGTGCNLNEPGMGKFTCRHVGVIYGVEPNPCEINWDADGYEFWNNVAFPITITYGKCKKTELKYHRPDGQAKTLITNSGSYNTNIDKVDKNPPLAEMPGIHKFILTIENDFKEKDAEVTFTALAPSIEDFELYGTREHRDEDGIIIVGYTQRGYFNLKTTIRNIYGDPCYEVIINEQLVEGGFPNGIAELPIDTNINDYLDVGQNILKVTAYNYFDTVSNVKIIRRRQNLIQIINSKWTISANRKVFVLMGFQNTSQMMNPVVWNKEIDEISQESFPQHGKHVLYPLIPISSLCQIGYDETFDRESDTYEVHDTLAYWSWEVHPDNPNPQGVRFTHEWSGRAEGPDFEDLQIWIKARVSDMGQPPGLEGTDWFFGDRFGERIESGKWVYTKKFISDSYEPWYYYTFIKES